MILQTLVQHYEDLVSRGDIAQPGWAKSKISYALCINDNGQLMQVLSLKTEQIRGKKTVFSPVELNLPAPVKRASGIRANFLWDNSSYILGLDTKGKPQRSRECFSACRQLHQKLLHELDSPAARALLGFFEHWDPSAVAEAPALADCLEDLISGVNITFYYNGKYVHEYSEIRRAWQEAYDGEEDDIPSVCLVTGRKAIPQAVHPSVKGVQGAQSSGAALVSFNAPAFCSYGKEQNNNAPVSKYGAFAYTAALNYLLADREHVYHIGDTTVVCWAAGGEPAFQTAFGGFVYGSETPYSENELRNMLAVLSKGEPVNFDNTLLSPERPFYILGLAPNAARLSIRFFLSNTFGSILENVQRHYDRLGIIRPAYVSSDILPPWRMLNETVNHNSRDKSPSPGMAGAVMWSILTDTMYPATLLNGVTLRIRAEHEISWGRAAIIKAYYLKNRHLDVPEEVLTVSLNPESTNIPYTLGRLFSTLEAVQSAANPGINATIKDKYFNSASATPSRVFPTLVNLAQKHLRKLEGGNKIFYEKQITHLCGILGTAYPDHLSLPEQGSFQLGYYHQTQERYTKKEEK